MRLQNSLDAEDVAGWVGMLESGAIGWPAASLDIDYARYGAGEARLAWLDETATLRVAEGQGRAVVVRIIGAIVDALRRHQAVVGHLKFFVRGAGAEAKVSFPTLDEAGWEQAVPPLSGTQVTLLINARVEMGAETLRDVVAQAIRQAATAAGAALNESAVAFFHPGFPNPTHRIP